LGASCPQHLPRVRTRSITWTSDGGALDVVTFLKESLWNSTRSGCLVAGREAMVGSRSCSCDMLELGNDDLLWPPASGTPVSHLSWVVVYFVCVCVVGFAFVGFTPRLAALYINLLPTYQSKPVKRIFRKKKHFARPHAQTGRRHGHAPACTVSFSRNNIFLLQ